GPRGCRRGAGRHGGRLCSFSLGRRRLESIHGCDSVEGRRLGLPEAVPVNPRHRGYDSAAVSIRLDTERPTEPSRENGAATERLCCWQCRTALARSAKHLIYPLDTSCRIRSDFSGKNRSARLPGVVAGRSSLTVPEAIDNTLSSRRGG